MTDLPRGWIKARLAEICHVEMGQAPPSSTYNTRGSGFPFLQGKSEFGNLYPTPKKFCEHPSKIAKSGAVLLSVRAPVGPTNIAGQEYGIGRGLAAISPLGGMSNRFVLWALRSHESALEKLGKGSTFAAITKAQVVSIPIKLPPLNEQRRIVEKIEALFAEIDRGIESLQAAKKTLGLYRQSLLKSAFEGRLTAEWRARNADKLESPDALLARIREERKERYKSDLDNWERAIAKWKKAGEKGRKPAKPKPALELKTLDVSPNRSGKPDSLLAGMMGTLPPSWANASLEELIASDGIFTDGDWVESKDQDPNGEVRLIQLADIADSRFVDKSSRFLTHEKADELNCTFLKKGDLMVARMPDPLGRCCIFPLVGERRFVTVVDVCIIRTGSAGMNPRYLMRTINSPVVRAQIAALQSGSTRKRISRKNLATVSIPIAPPAEQHEIARILDARLGAAETLDQEIDANLARAGALRQSILKKAFAGQLVSQDPNDEPAAALLARIRAARDEATKPGKGRFVHAN